MMASLLARVKECGALPSDVVFVNLYLTDMRQFKRINSMYVESFGYNPPSRACVQVVQLPKGARCMVDCMGYAGSGANVGDRRCEIPRGLACAEHI